MITLFIFYVSGGVVVLLLMAKMWESKRHTSFPLIKMISRGDEGFRKFSHDATHTYSVWKERSEFFVKKQLPLHTKNTINKTETLIREKAEKYLGNVRNSKLLQPKNEGLSEFFKNMSKMEKDNAEASEDIDTHDKKISKALDTPKKKI